MTSSRPGFQRAAFVTGASGFIGSRLLTRLLDAQVPVRCLRLPGDESPVAPGASFWIGDLADLDSVIAAMGDASVVFHLGGMASAPLAQERPYEAFRANTLGAQNVVEAARRAGAERVVILSTAHVYGAPATLPVTEHHPFAPASVYAATKLAGDMLALAYHRNLGVPVNVLRAFNVYGPGQQAGAVVPTIVEQAVRKGTVHVQDLRPKRDFVFVEDVVDAMIAAAVAPIAGEQILLASGRPVSVRTLVRTVLSIVGASIPPNLYEEDDIAGNCVYGDAEHALSTLGWEPRVSLTAGLERMIAWWRERIGNT